MNQDDAKTDRKAERLATLPPSPRAGGQPKPGWSGPTYYGRSQLKSAPFNNWIVGGYIFLAGLSGSASMLGALSGANEGLARRARQLSLLAPTVGSALLIKDLHTPQRFYNMLRLYKPRSPMSIGTWILMTFGASAVPAAIASFLADRLPGCNWMRGVTKAAQAPAAVAGAGLSVYTASLLSATSAPVWAAAPAPLAVRFGASSMASAAAALSLAEDDRRTRQALHWIAAGALGVEAIAATAQVSAYRHKGVEHGTEDRWGKTEKRLATGAGVLLPLALFGAAIALGRRGRGAGQAAAVLTLAGSALLRVTTLGMGDESALRPEVSLRFAQPENLPKPESGAAATGDVTPRTRQPRRQLRAVS